MKGCVGILSLGCPRNLVDAEHIAGNLKKKGYSVTQDLAKADIALVNTCSFIEDAKRESIDAIIDLIELKKSGKLKKVLVYGCLAERYKKELSLMLPEVDAFVGKASLDASIERFALVPKHYAYLKICEGCINNCSYCVIPKIKGKFVSFDEKRILKQASKLNREAISELNIIGQDITAFGMDGRGSSSLPDILRKIVNVCPDIYWIRLLYLNPERVSDELIKFIRDTPQICKYIDLPLQHINNRILKLMRRKTNKEKILRLIKKIRDMIPGVALRTSLIVGFPSETNSEFKELLDFVKDVKFERLGVFQYSREEGTKAYNFKGQIGKEIKKERYEAIMSEQQKISEGINKIMPGKRIDCLIEEKGNECYIGRSQFDAPEVDGLVYVKSKKALKLGQFVNVKINDTYEYDLAGELCHEYS